LVVNDAGEISEVSEYKCKVGKKYAQHEYKAPKRVLTATVKTENSDRRLMPVRSNKPVPKEKLGDCMSVLAGIKVKPTHNIGDVVVNDILCTVADIICTDDL
jgi:CxxC motif-containing protein